MKASNTIDDASATGRRAETKAERYDQMAENMRARDTSEKAKTEAGMYDRTVGNAVLAARTQ